MTKIERDEAGLWLAIAGVAVVGVVVALNIADAIMFIGPPFITERGTVAGMVLGVGAAFGGCAIVAHEISKRRRFKGYGYKRPTGRKAA